LRRALSSILGQDSDASIEIIVVFDQTEIDDFSDVEVPAAHSLRGVVNGNSTGLAGARNTGIMLAQGEYLAFCDDDDEWLPSKLRRQLELWSEDPAAAMVSTGITIQTADGDDVVRLPPARVEFKDLLLSRITEIHPSSFLFRRLQLIDDYGLVDEELPASYGEDYDLLLRVARHGHVASVLEPLIIVHWNRASYFTGKWEGIASGLSYLLDKYPEFETSPRGSARIEGQIAFAHAALGRRTEARHWARRALKHDRGQMRAYAAIAIASGIAPAGTMVDMVNRRGRGL
jgi:glycosyltransferase involved in cell wall biosynthesis